MIACNLAPSRPCPPPSVIVLDEILYSWTASLRAQTLLLGPGQLRFDNVLGQALCTLADLNNFPYVGLRVNIR